MPYVIQFQSQYSPYFCYQSHSPVLASTQQRWEVREFAWREEALAKLASHKVEEGGPIPPGVPGAYLARVVPLEGADFDPALWKGFLFECPQKTASREGWTPPPLFPAKPEPKRQTSLF